MIFGSAKQSVGGARPRGGDERSSFQLCNDAPVRPDFFSISESVAEEDREGSVAPEEAYRPLRQRLARLKRGDEEVSRPETHRINLEDFLVVGEKYPGSEPISHDASLLEEAPTQPSPPHVQGRPKKLTAREYLSRTAAQPSIRTYQQQDLTLTGLEAQTDEPAVSNVIIHRGDREFVPKPVPCQEGRPPTAQGQDRDHSRLEEQYVESIQNLTTLLTQNTTLVRTALDTINAVVTRPMATTEIDPKAVLEKMDRPARVPATAATTTITVPTATTATTVRPEPVTKPRETGLKTRIPSVPSVPSVPATSVQPARASSPDLIGVPIVAPRSQVTGAIGFLDALLLGEDSAGAEGDSLGVPTPTNPDMIKLASLATQLEARVDEVCGDVWGRPRGFSGAVFSQEDN